MEYNLILNFKRSEILQTDIVFSQGDYGKAMLRLSCRDDDVPITGAQSATISFSTPNGYLVTGELVGGDGEYSYTFKGNELQAPGRITATVSLKWADGRLSSCLFSFKCRAVQGGTAIDSGNYLTEVDQVVQEAKAKIAELQKLIDQLKPGIGSTALTKADLQNDLTQEQSGIKALDALQGKVLEKMLNDLSDKMSNELKTYVSKKQIINNLLSTVPGNVLDAMQGKALGDRLSKTEQSITQLNSDWQSGRTAFVAGNVGRQSVSVNFQKEFSAPPRVFACWNDNENIFDYCSFLSVKNVSKSGFEVCTERKKNTANWWFFWLAIATKE